MVPVTISGTASGAGVTSISYKVTDEYKKVQPSGTATVNANGTYSFVVSLEAYRNGNDMDGRFYTILLTATDRFGRITTTTVIVRVPHDQQ
jgi:peptidoglycan hydrolase-like protein with peptidoglycan-binding domain